MQEQATWISFNEQPNAGKTKIFVVYPKNAPTMILGHIKWYGPWRCYGFYPAPNCVFEKTCLKDITKQIEKLMLDRKLEKQKI